MDFPKSVPGVGLVDNQFVDEDEVNGTPGSLIPAKWGNDVTKEILGVLDEAGIAPDEDNPEQLRHAVVAIVDKVAPVASEQDEQEGTDNIKRMTPLRVAEAIARRIPADTTIYQFGHIGGLTLANNAATPSSDIDISSGSARAASNNASLLLAATLTKRLQSAGVWAAGAGGNGLFAGLRAPNTWYHVFLIRRDSDGAVDAGFDTSIQAANRPAGYGKYRRIGSVRTDAAGDIIPFLQVGRSFHWRKPIVDVALTSFAANTSQVFTISVPPGVRVLARLSVGVRGGNAGGYVAPPDFEVIIAGLQTAYLGGFLGSSGDNDDYAASEINSPTDTESQVRFGGITTNALSSVRLVTYGWNEEGL